MRWTRRLVAIGVFVAILIGGWQFAGRNSARVSVDFLGGRFDDVVLWVALLGAFGAGAALTGLLSLYQIVKIRMVTRRYRKAVQGLEAEVHQLRTLPLAEARAADSAEEPEEVALSRKALGRSA